MVKRCVAANCSNSHKEGVSLFQFPKNPELRKKWIKQVQRTRAKWSGPGSEGAVLCSDHFERECFEPSSLLAQSMGIKKKLLLKPDAVPTIFKKPSHVGSQVLQSQASAVSDLPSTSKRSRHTSAKVQEPNPKRSRRAFEKRERLRVSLYTPTLMKKSISNYFLHRL